jgi:hypothetical protein
MRLRFGGLLLVGAVVAVATAVVAQPAFADNGYYQIVNAGSGKCAEANRFAGAGNGVVVLQATCDRDASQMWKPNITSNGRYLLENRAAPGVCLDVEDGVDADRTRVQEWSCTGGLSMQWIITTDPFGQHQLISGLNGHRCLDVAGASLQDGARIQIYHCTGFGNLAQVWNLVP